MIDKINSGIIVLEVGSLSGKWTQYMLNAKKIIAVDINNYFVEFLKNKFKNAPNIDFYITTGHELNGIAENSVDLIFSIDTMIRIKEKYIRNYIKEISKVLVVGGVAILHLPNKELPMSKSFGFTSLTTKK